jgi:hypothetical protein
VAFVVESRPSTEFLDIGGHVCASLEVQNETKDPDVVAQTVSGTKVLDERAGPGCRND